MTAPRPTPFDLVFDAFARDRFPEIRASLAASRVEPANRDAFLLDRHVVLLLRDIVPDEGVGEAVDQHVALLHNAYLYWDSGQQAVRVSRARSEAAMSEETLPSGGALLPGTAYIQFPERMIWAQVTEGEPHQPLDGLFVTPTPPDAFTVLAVFGMHPERGGFSVAEVAGRPGNERQRPDGTPLFAPLLAGGKAAGLYSVDGPTELVELGARALRHVSGAEGVNAGTRPGEIFELS